MRWTIKPTPEFEKIKTLSEALQVDHLIAKLLLQRGITTYEEARQFFQDFPSYDRSELNYQNPEQSHKAFLQVLKLSATPLKHSLWRNGRNTQSYAMSKSHQQPHQV